MSIALVRESSTLSVTIDENDLRNLSTLIHSLRVALVGWDW
jgi:hypothetical protein